SGEVKSAVDVSEVGGIDAEVSYAVVGGGDQSSALDTAVGLPELDAMGVAEGEVERVADGGEAPRGESGVGDVGAGEHEGAGGGAVGFPELSTIRTIIASEEQPTIEGNRR